MFWILSQNIDYDDRIQLLDIFKAETEFFGEYDQDLILLPLYLSEFFIWREEKELFGSASVYKERYKNEKIRNMMDRELYILLRHIEDDPRLYKKDLEDFIEFMNK